MSNHIDAYRLAVDLLDITRERLATLPRRVTLDELWTSMSFCVLSSNVRLGAANKAHNAVLAAPHLFDDACCKRHLQPRIQRRLNHVGYRFHNSKAKQLTECWTALKIHYDQLVDLILESKSPYSIRAYIIETFPGLGIKQASMFLRDIGATCEVAIIDVHIKRFLAAHMTDFNSSNKKEYLEAESWLGDLAYTHDCSIAAMDLAIWAAMKTVGSAKLC